MLKFLLAVTLLVFVHCLPLPTDDPSVDSGESVTDQMVSRVVLPDMGEGVQAPDVSQCLDPEIFQKSELIQTDGDMLCAFIAFQANKDPLDAVYASKEEATMRYGIFVECVGMVQRLNSDHQGWKAGVNMFCDMTDEEIYPYFHGIPEGDTGSRIDYATDYYTTDYATDAA